MRPNSLGHLQDVSCQSPLRLQARYLRLPDPVVASGSQPVNQLPEAPGRFAAQIPDAQELNHVAVFLTGQAPFPEGYGCTIHLEAP